MIVYPGLLRKYDSQKGRRSGEFTRGKSFLDGLGVFIPHGFLPRLEGS